MPKHNAFLTVTEFNAKQQLHEKKKNCNRRLDWEIGK